jgi:dienelactone hydrolase
LFAWAVSPSALAAAGVPEKAIASARQFVDLLSQGDFAAAENRFDGVMQQALPQAQLEGAWQNLQQQAGPFKKQLHTRTLQYGGYDIVLVGCQFQNMLVDAKIVFDQQGRVSGLFFVPGQAAAPPPQPAAPAAYVRPSAFREEPFTVGKGNWRLPGTLTLPTKAGAGPWPAVVLVHGSGPNDRDETVGANKPFRDLAWGLAGKGIAVLRYEKRTKEYAERLNKSGLAHFTAKEEVLEDALSAAEALRRTRGIDSHRVFILGHSLGGALAPRLGLEDRHLAGLIILAGPTRSLEDLMLQQTCYVLALKGEPSPTVKSELDQMAVEVEQIKKLTKADASRPGLILGAPASYWLDINEHDPVVEAKKLKQPVLILQGGRDYQVTPDNFERWKADLGSRKNFTLKFYPELNHLFMAGKGKSTPAEYDQPGHVAEAVIDDIARWVGTVK